MEHLDTGRFAYFFSLQGTGVQTEPKAEKVTGPAGPETPETY